MKIFAMKIFAMLFCAVSVIADILAFPCAGALDTCTQAPKNETAAWQAKIDAASAAFMSNHFHIFIYVPSAEVYQ